MLNKLKIMFVTAAVLVGGAAGIAAAEGGPMKQQARGAMHAERKAKLLATFDVNKDGTLDAAEKRAMHDARAMKQFARLDKDGNGLLSIEEFKAGSHHQGRNHRGKLRGGRGGDARRGERGGGGDHDEP